MMFPSPAVSALLLSLLIVSPVTAQETDAPSVAPVTASPTAAAWGGCVDPDKGFEKVTIGDPTTVCLQLGNGENWAAGVEYIRMTFQPKADEYTRFFVPQSYDDLLIDRANDASSVWFQTDVTLGVASQYQLSFLRRFFQFEAGRVFPYLTAIIDVKDGNVQGITWDDACVFCGSGACVENTLDYNGVQQTQKSSGQPTEGCFIEQEECNTLIIEDERTDCDLLLYVVWTGTDSEGRAFQSAANRFSNFPEQELQDRLSSNLPKVVQDFRREREL